MVTIKSKVTDGTWQYGQYVETVDWTTDTILASVQPMTGNDLLSLPEGRRESEGVKMYTDIKTDIGSYIVWNSKEYEIKSEAYHGSNVINHYKYMAVRDVTV